MGKLAQDERPSTFQWCKQYPIQMVLCPLKFFQTVDQFLRLQCFDVGWVAGRASGL